MVSQMNYLIDATFHCPTNPTAILFLVEDTDFMTCLQHPLRDTHLLTILEAVYKKKSPSSVGSLTHRLLSVTLSPHTG